MNMNITLITSAHMFLIPMIVGVVNRHPLLISLMLLLVITSILNHGYNGYRLLDRGYAGTITAIFTAAAFVYAYKWGCIYFFLAGTMGLTAAAMYTLAKKRKDDRYHVALHLVGATGFTLFSIGYARGYT